jgi:glucose-1-phosphate adenylyltransferase
VLTQFNSVSLNRHVSRTYQFDSFHVGWLQIWAAEQTMQSADWYQGTADAVRKQQLEIRSTHAPDVLILAGDHLYRMDYAAMAKFHWDNNADITVAVQPVAGSDASRFGILKRDQAYRLSEFAEKPRDPQILSSLTSRDDTDRPYLGSMGIYLFKTEVLFELLSNPTYDDFGGDVIPSAIGTHSVYGFDFDDYWEDIGTIRSFYKTNLMLTRHNAPFNFFDGEKPIYTHPRFLPGSTVEESRLENVLLTEGCCIRKAHISGSIIGLRSQIHEKVRIIDSILMGNDFYESESPNRYAVPMGIGESSRIQGAIIDKNACIGEGVRISPFPAGTDINGDNWYVRDGIVVIPKGGVINPGTNISP